MSPTFLALGLILAILVLIPARRLYLAGWSSGSIAIYYVGLWALAFVVAWLPGRSRFLVPLLVIGYLLPFVTFRQGIDRLARRIRQQPDARDVTPPDQAPRAGRR